MRLAAIHAQLQLPRPMPKVVIPFNIQMLQRTGVDFTVCPKCKEGKMIIINSYLRHNGQLVNVKDLNKRQSASQKIKLAAAPPT